MLLDAIRQSISETFSAAGIACNDHIGVAFSGGVDSTLLAEAIPHKTPRSASLLTVGFEGSHDIKFSQIASTTIPHFDHVIKIIESERFAADVEIVSDIIKTDSMSWLENCIAFYYVSKLAQENGISKVVTANGIDELFCGYDAYRRIYGQGQKAIGDLMKKKLDNEVRMSRAINTVTSMHDVQVLQPLLHPIFVDVAKKIPISDKIHGSDDMLRKHAIRRLARQMGISIACAKKKSLQYGSGIHKALLRVRRASVPTGCP